MRRNRIKITESLLRNIVRESLNEISLNTLNKARRNIENNGITSSSISALRTIMGVLDFYSEDMKNPEAVRCIQYLKAIKNFILRKLNQYNNITDNYENREYKSGDKLEKYSMSMFNKDPYDLTEEEIQQMYDSIDDDDVKYYIDNNL